MLYTQEENLNNGEHDLFSCIFFSFSGGGAMCLILEHFWYNCEHLRYIYMYIVSENVNEVRWYVVPRIFLEKLHNLLRCFVHFAKSFASHALSEMMLLRGELGRITFDVGSRVPDI